MALPIFMPSGFARKLRLHFIACIALVFGLPNSGMVFAAGFGGPNAVGNVIQDDAQTRPATITRRMTQGWFDWKQNQQEDNGFSLGFDYTPVYFKSSEKGASGEDKASSGMLRVYGSWDLVGRGTKNIGSRVYKISHRHSYTDVAPKGFGFDQGYAGMILPPFSDQGARWTNLYWRQRLNEAQTTVLAGMLDVTDFVDVYALASPWTGFMNFAFSTGSASIFTPNDAALGIAGGTMLNDNLFLIGSLANAYTDSSDPFATVDDFFSENEYFSSVELGWTRSQGRIYQDNMHITLWHVDESVPAETPGGWGVAFNYSRSLNEDRFMPFFRGGYAHDAGSLLQKSLSLGFGYNVFDGRDQFGIAANWGQPNESTFGPGLEDQQVLEAYYRWQITEQFALTPDIQYLINPALNPDHDSLWVFGLRGRLAL